MKIHLVEVELFHANGQRDGRAGGWTDGRTDPTKLPYSFRNFVKASKVLQIYYLLLSKHTKFTESLKYHGQMNRGKLIY